MYRPVPALLRAARVKAGLRRETAAEDQHVSCSAIASYELGNCCPSAPILIGLARLYGVAVEDLCAEAEDPRATGTEAGAR